jgi:hypothetical protein
MGKTSSLKNVQTGSETHTASYAMGTAFLFWGVKMNTHLNLVLRLRMSGTISPLPPYAFMAWTGTTMLLTQYNIKEDMPDGAVIHNYYLSIH